ncbi:MAG: PDZ domain-containing protein [Pseudomonadota bacterium]
MLDEQLEEKKPRVTIRSPEPQEEFGVIWHTLLTMPFYRKHGYNVALPDHKIFEELVKLPPNIRDAKKKETYELFSQHIYRKACYEEGLSSLDDTEKKTIAVFPRFEKLKKQWGFKVFHHYDVVLTLYGPGGHFNPRTGKVVLKTTADGSFKRGDPIHTIIHEMVHIGIHENIVKRFRLTHWEKERVVDLICSIKFGDILKNYTIQAGGERNLDTFVSHDSLSNLPAVIGAYIKRYPRELEDGKIIRRGVVDIVIVEKVHQGTQAETIGLKEGDIIVEYDGEKITRPQHLAEVVKKKSNMDKVCLIIIRDCKVRRFALKGGPIGIKVGKKTMLKEEMVEDF